MIKEVAYNTHSKEVLTQLQKGAFLNVKVKDEINTMTIGWGTIGYIWKKPIFTVLVRYSRHTYEMLKETDEFTVSIPLKNNLGKELAFCGTKSKRDCDKFEEYNLTPIKGQKVSTPIIEECDLHYECKIICRQKLEGSQMEQLDEKFYSDDNYHVLFYGEIVSSYWLNK